MYIKIDKTWCPYSTDQKQIAIIFDSHYNQKLSIKLGINFPINFIWFLPVQSTHLVQLQFNKLFQQTMSGTATVTPTPVPTLGSSNPIVFIQERIKLTFEDEIIIGVVVGWFCLLSICGVLFSIIFYFQHKKTRDKFLSDRLDASESNHSDDDFPGHSDNNYHDDEEKEHKHDHGSNSNSSDCNLNQF